MAKNKEFLTEDELELVYDVLSEYSDDMDGLLGDGYSGKLYDLYLKLSKKFEDKEDDE